ncbi:hypothetical protein GDN83_08440 [Gordonia jinghuaiqii]|uniref:Uncharacterized protein n=1 Tax=Gordonia jinghuaiqii TaxID=2758710 RepID=A0A7D7R3P3_9ACTN|nr:hypothetical protein [Gordonia jinghuaiqii]MCR5977767.1 hypothetical protein [Gordonia jinghuaiqii]QMT02427.1 hypothetical protein H1R19_04515 [Gordonia jinghuaiqii]
MTSPDPEQRPKLVVWAYRCWLASGALLVLLGALVVILSAVADSGTVASGVLGVMVIVVGVAYVLLGSKAFTGDVRWRSSLSALTLVVVAMLLFLSVGLGSPLFALALIAALIGLFGSLLAYRPDPETWYTGKAPEPKKSRPRKKNP